MTRKDFELIAKVLRNSSEIVDDVALEALAEQFADALAETNGAFNRPLFIAKATATDSKVQGIIEKIGA